MTVTSTEMQMEAWAAYAAAKRLADQTLKVEDGAAAAAAYVRFLNLFLNDDHRLPEKRTANNNVELFPVHKSRSPRMLGG